MIQISNLTKRYGKDTVYENFNLSLEEGKITCILGESGCGKTTLLNCIANLTEYSGNIPKLEATYVFQTPRLVPCLTVKQNLELVCKDGGKIENILTKVGLSDKADKYPATLSGGEAQRVSLARAFVFGGDILLLDEPFSSLDLKLKFSVCDLFLSMQREKNITALFVTHDIEEALKVADRIIVLKKSGAYEDIAKNTGKEDDLRKKLMQVLMSE
ncbi:MAG: ABC transporter ATP-binding protein [Clostridiales bacterium]|nr:ABC transporter ATP-binding protein [Clostridiales bacterium]